MYIKKLLLFLLTFFSLSIFGFAQEDSLMLLLEQESAPKSELVTGTFKGTRIINGQSVENVGEKVLQFQISHRFGLLNSGSYQFFGLDEATLRLGLDYGITSRLAAGIGRSSYNKAYDGYLKFKLIRQSTGEKNIPLSVVLYSNISANTEDRSTPDRDIEIIDRLSFSHQILIAKKFNEKLSLQISPSYIHRNVVPTSAYENDVFAVGFQGRFKLTKRTSLNAEYFYLLPGHTADNFYNSFSIGFDIETGGHVFQLHVTNSQGMIESQFIPQTTGDFLDGDIHFGFNISRVFGSGKKKKTW